MKYILSIVIALGLTTIGFSQFNPQSRKITEKYFKDFDFEITTPAFQKKKGFTKYKELITFLDSLKQKHPNQVNIQYIGKSQKGKEIPMVTISNPSNDSSKLRVWVQGGLHGNEPASTEGALYLMQQILETPELNKMLNNIILTIVPMANIDGYEKQDRYAANGLDLNRDQTKLLAQESQHLKLAFSNYHADVALDMHEYRPYRKDFIKFSEFGTTSYFDVMFLYSGNLNVPEPLRNFTKEKFVYNACLELDKHQLSHREYISTTSIHGELQFNQGSTNSRSSATSFALSHCISSLIEVRGVGIGRTSFKRRVFTTYSVALSYITTAANNMNEIKSILASTKPSLNKDIVITSKKKVYGDSLPMIDIASSELIQLPVIIRDSWQSKPEKTRNRPTSYIILPGNDEIIKRLHILGIETSIINTNTEMNVEVYTVVDLKTEPYKYEGVKRQFTNTTLSKEKKSIPIGSHRVSLDQKRANLLIEVMEPESGNSFVTFHLIECELNKQLPYYRISTTKTINEFKTL